MTTFVIAIIRRGLHIRKAGKKLGIIFPWRGQQRLENLTAEPLKIIEVQTGAYLEEDDIVRLEDDYWRLSGDSHDTKN